MKLMVMFILILCFWSSYSYAVKCNQAIVKKIKSNPESAPNIAIGRYFLSDHKIKVIKSWNTQFEQVKLDGVTDAGYSGLIDNEFYLLLAADLPSNRPFANVCNSMLIPVKESVDILQKLAGKNDFKGSINPAWQFCEQDSECLKLKDQCENQVGVNKKYQLNFLEFLKTKDKKSCGKVKVSVTVSKCIEYFCS